MRTQLRDYQRAAVDAVFAEWDAGRRRVVLAAPCGSGKTVMGVAAMERHVAAGGRAMFLVDRKPLLWQTRRALEREDVDYGLLHERPEPRNGAAAVLLTTHQTLDSRIRAHGGLPPYAAGRDLLAIDEVHLVFDSTVKVARRVVEAGGRLLGLTATPTGAGVHCGKAFDALVEGPTANALVAAGNLVAPDHRLITAGLEPAEEADLDRRLDATGDWADGAVGEVMGEASRIERIADEWLEHVGHYRTPPRCLIFAATKEQARAQMMACKRRMNARWGAQWEARLFVDDTPQKFREDAIALFANGPVRILASVRALAVGFDEPAAEVLLDCRPAKRSWNAWQQGYGRICRAAEGKDRALYLDASANLTRFGKFAEHVKANGYRVLPVKTVRGSSTKSWKCRGRLACAGCGAVRGARYDERRAAKDPGWAPPCESCGRSCDFQPCDAENKLSAFACATCAAPRPEHPPKDCDACGRQTFQSAVACPKCGYVFPGGEQECPEHKIPLQQVRGLVDGKMQVVDAACVFPGCEFDADRRRAKAADDAAAADELAAETAAEAGEDCVKPWKVLYDDAEHWGIASDTHRRIGETVLVRARNGNEWCAVVAARARAVWPARGRLCYLTRRA